MRAGQHLHRLPKKLMELVDTDLCYWQYQIDRGIPPSFDEIQRFGKMCKNIRRALPGQAQSERATASTGGGKLDGANTGGSARLSYESNFAESCRLIDEYDQHQTSVAFRLDGDQLIFDLELPIQWNFNN
ncbi:UNVERIFIED_CONTAM: hypothetical protein K2H54_000266 [Gekko kuhli]